MSKSNSPLAYALALALILPFASGAVQAADPAKSGADKVMVETAKKAPPPPTIDTNKDGKADAWDRDANGIPDAWDINDDGRPDLFDDNGDGKPDDKPTAGKAPPPPADNDDGQPEGQ